MVVLSTVQKIALHKPASLVSYGRCRDLGGAYSFDKLRLASLHGITQGRAFLVKLLQTFWAIFLAGKQQHVDKVQWVLLLNSYTQGRPATCGTSLSCTFHTEPYLNA